MSLILDALNRSREDANPVPGLATHHSVELVSVDRRQYLLWVALSVAVVIIAWLVMEHYSAPQLTVEEIGVQVAQLSRNKEQAATTDVSTVSERTSAPSQETPAAVVTTVAPAELATPLNVEQLQPVQETVSPAGESRESGSEVFPAQEMSEEPLAADTSAVNPTPDTAAMQESLAAEDSSLPAENDAVAQLYQNPNLAEEPTIENPVRRAAARAGADQSVAVSSSAGTRSEQSVDIERILQEARQEVENASLESHPVPFLIDLPQQVKDGIPTVYYLRHDYSSNPSQSTVVLNSKTLHVGDSAASGMKLEEILPDSVVLNYQGTQFRLRALNSWVNL